MCIVIKITEWNDVERALGALGIQLRTSVDTFKSFDDLLEEIASRWDTFSSVQQAAIGTSLAGTRQREAFTTLMANWGDVSKYEELADNAYGTAVEKMKVYTDSIEAAKTRMSAALDKWVLQFSTDDIMKTFYNAVADVAENLTAWAGSIATIVAIMNAGKLIQGGAKLLGNIGTGFMGITNNLFRIKNSKAGMPEVGSVWANVKETISDNFLTQQKSRYGSVLTKQIASMDGLTEGNKEELTAVLGTMQNIILNGESQNQSKIATELSNGATQEHFENLKKLISSEDAMLISNNLLNGTTGELNSTIQLLKQAYLEQLIEIERRKAFGLNKNGEANWDFAPQEAKDKWKNKQADKIKQKLTSGENDAYLTIGALNKDTASEVGGKTGTYITEGIQGVGENIGSAAGQTAGKAMLTGIVSMVSGSFGTWAGSVIGETLGGSTGKTIGSTLMGTITSILPAFGVKGMIVSGIISGISTIFAAIKTAINKATEKAKKEFQEAAEAYNNAKSMKSIAEKYDELSKGVDSFGRNLTLTDEEYSQFLEYSQQLVEVFPELYMCTDEQGNVIAKLGDEAESTAEKVANMTKQLKDYSNYKMVGGGIGSDALVMEEAVKTAAKEYKDLYEQQKEKVRESQMATSNAYSKQKDLSILQAIGDLDLQLAGQILHHMTGYEGTNLDTDSEAVKKDLLNYFKGQLTEQNYDTVMGQIRSFVEIAGTGWRNEYSVLGRNNYLQAFDYAEKFEGTNENELQNLISSYQSSAEHAKQEADFLTFSMEGVSQELNDYVKAYAEVYGLFNGADEDLTTIYNSLLQNIAPVSFDENGDIVELDADGYKAKIEQVANAAQSVFKDNTASQEKVLLRNNSETQGEFIANSQKLLEEVLNDNDFQKLQDQEQQDFLISLGFSIDNQAWKEEKAKVESNPDYIFNFSGVIGIEKDYAAQIAELQKDGLALGINAATINGLSKSDAAQAYKWVKSGYITNDNALQAALGFSSEAKDVIQSRQRVEYYNSLMAPGKNGEQSLYNKRLNSFYSGLTQFYSKENGIDENALKEAIGNQFADMGPETWAGLYQNAEKYLNDDAKRLGQNFSEELQNSITLGWDNWATKWQDDAKIELQFAFGELDIDGAVDSWSELETIFGAIKTTTDDLNSAFEEQNKVGHLGIQTVLGLLSSNANYIEALEVVDGKIRLKTNAEEIMMKVQLSAAIASVSALIATKKARAEEIKAQMSQIIANGTYQESVSDTVNALNVEGQAVTNLTNAYLGLADAINLIGDRDEETQLLTAKGSNAWNFSDKATWNNLEGKTAQVSNITSTLRGLASEYEQTTGDKIKFIYDSSGSVIRTQAYLDKNGNTVIDKEKPVLKGSNKKLIGFDVVSGDGSEGIVPIAENLRDVLLDTFNSAGSIVQAYLDAYDPSSGLEDAAVVAEKLKELLEALDALIDKEYESMKAFNKTGKESDTEYYILKEASLKNQQRNLKEELDGIQEQLANNFAGISEEDLWENPDWLELKREEADINKELIRIYKELNNLDDERVEDQYNLAELQGASLDTLIEIQKEYITTSDTEQERVERQKKLNELVQEEFNLRREVNKYFRENIIDRALEHNAVNAYDNGIYDELVKEKTASLNRDQEILKGQIFEQYNKTVDGYIATGKTPEEAAALALTGDSENSKTLRELVSAWYETEDEKTTTIVNAIQAKLDDLERRQKLIEDARPEEWTSTDQIEESYNAVLKIGEEKEAYLKSVLENDELLSNMTSDQIVQLTNDYNEAVLANKETRIKLREEKKSLQETQYSAIKYQIDLYKDELQDAIDDVNDAYDDQLNKLRENNEELQRQANLEDLLAAKKRANQEKERVYREGIGWVYESNRTSQKQAQDDLDDFYRQDKIDDLEKTRDAEVQALQDIIDAWDKYLKNLEWYMNEFERWQNAQVLMRLMGVDTIEEVNAKIKADMLDFNSNVEENYKNFGTIFEDNLIKPYTEGLKELQELKEQESELLAPKDSRTTSPTPQDIVDSSIDYQQEINKIKLDPNSYDENGNLTAEAKNNIDILEAKRNQKIQQNNLKYAQTTNQSSYTDPRTDKTIADYTKEYYEARERGDWEAMAHANAMANFLRTGKAEVTATAAIEAVKKKSQAGGYSNSSSYVGTTYGITSAGTQSTSNTTSKDNTTSDNTTSDNTTSKDTNTSKNNTTTNTNSNNNNNNNNNKNNSSSSVTVGSGNRKDTTYIDFQGETVPSRANGILGGPVTYTGLTMLHGSPSSPEYVLNSEQAYNILRNMATTKLPEMTSNMANQNGGTSYVVQGDVVLENVNDPAEFWDSVTEAMRSRYNVTKNSRG